MSFLSSVTKWFRKQPTPLPLDGEVAANNVPEVRPASVMPVADRYDSGVESGDRQDGDIFVDALPRQLQFESPRYDSTPRPRMLPGDEPLFRDNVPSVRRKEKEPARFNGKSDWSDYLIHFQYVAEWNGWTEEEMGLQLAICLTDEAREVLSSLRASDKHNFSALVDALGCRYSPQGRESQYLMELMNRTCGSDEDVSSFGHTLRRLASKAYPDKPADEKMLVNLFIKGLRDIDMKRHVYLEKPQNLTEAIHSAVTYEAFDKPARDGNRKPRVTIAPVQGKGLKQLASQNDDHPDPGSGGGAVRQTSISGNESDLAEQVRELKATVAELRAGAARNRRPQHNRCYLCDLPGHIARNCRQNGGSNYSNSHRGNGANGNQQYQNPGQQQNNNPAPQGNLNGGYQGGMSN